MNDAAGEPPVAPVPPPDPVPARPSRRDEPVSVSPAAAGALAALAGLAAAELVGLVLPGRPSPVTLAADRVVSSTPDSLRESVITLVGTGDKPLVVALIVLVVVAGGALIGQFARTRDQGAIGLVAGGVVGFLVAWDGAVASVLSLAVVVAAGAATAVLVWRRLVPAASPVATDEDDGAVVDRRTVLRTVAVVGALSAAGLLAAALVRRTSSAAVDAVRVALRLPAPTDPAAPVPAAATPAVPGLAPALTPTGDFYQIDTALSPPTIDVASWRLSVTGRVDHPVTLSFDDLLALPSIERVVTLTCVSNPVGGDLVGTARWQGVRLTDLLERAGAHADASAIVGVSDDGFTAGFPRTVLADGRDAMVAYAMNGEPLPVRHGFPARIVVPGLYGYVSATKWLTEIRLTTLEEDVPFWVARGWSDDGTIASASRIDVPRDGASVAAGPVTVAGRAWHQHVGVAGVAVSVDGGAWQDATLAASLGTDGWRLWTWQWDATPGDHQLRVRMRDTSGQWQSQDAHGPFPGAASGLHQISVHVD